MKSTPDIASYYKLYVNDLVTYALYLGFEKEIILDAIHDIFCKLATDWDMLDSVENVKFYLFKSLKNKLLDTYKLQKHYVDLSTAEVETPFKIQITVEDELIDSEEQALIKKRISEMLETLTDRQREIIYLRYIHGYDYSQISDLLNISIHGCHKLVSKAIANLRAKFGTPLVLLFFCHLQDIIS